MAMLFNVSGLMQEGIGATRQHEIDGSLEAEGRESEPLTGQVELLRTKTGVLVRAHLQITATDACSRCLRPLSQVLSVDFEEEFQATVDRHTGEPVTDRPDGDDFLIDENHMLDLTEAVRQYREAVADMQPLCRPDCLGICPDCGKDRNSGECSCAEAPVDSRWAALAGLLPNTEGKE